MKRKPPNAGDSARLRRQAEARLRKQKTNPGSKVTVGESTADNRRLLHELQVHHVELQMQNEALQEARDTMETLLAKYADLYEFAPVCYLTLDPQGVIQEVNLTGAVLFGVGRSELVNRRLLSFIAPVSRDIVRAFLENVFASSSKQVCEAALLRPDGSKIWGDLHGANAFSVNGSQRSCRMVISDVTSIKTAEDKVRVSEIRYRRLFEAAHDGVLILDPKTRKITDANPFMTELLGYSREQLVGKELFEIGLLKDEVASQEMFLMLKQNHEVRYEDLPLKSKEGRHQEVEVVASLYQENDRSAIQCNIRDITERKQAEATMRRNEALFTALIEQAPVGVYVVDSSFRLHKANSRAMASFNNVPPPIGRDFSEILHLIWPGRVADQLVSRFRNTLKTGMPYQSLDFSERRLDTALQEIYEWQIQRVTLPAGEHGVVCFFDEISERKRAEATRRRVAVLDASNRKLELEIIRRQKVEEDLHQSEEHLIELSEQARHLSHQILHAQEDERKRISRELHDEIAQTLVGINVRLATLSREAHRDPDGLVQKLVRAQRLVADSVEKVHRFARELRPTALDDLGLIPTLHTFLKEFTTRTGVRARLTAFAGVEKLDIVKRTILYRVAHEALNNVASHAKASRVEVSIEKRTDCVSMEIKDDGKSFDPDHVIRANRGKRLGLLGMRERLEMVNGTFSIESAPGKGTIVRAQVPAGKMVRGGARKALKTIAKVQKYDLD